MVDVNPPAQEDVRSDPTFAVIPEELRDSIDTELRLVAFDILHAEVVASGDFPPAPDTLFDKMPGRIAKLSFAVGFGLVVGTLSTVIVVYLLRTLAPIL